MTQPINKVINDVESNIDEVVLNDQQKKDILELWNSRPKNPPTLKDLTLIAFPNTRVDGRSKEGKAVRNFLAARSITPETNVIKTVGEYFLNFNEIEFIKNNMKNTKPVEIVKLLFPRLKEDPKKIPLSKEFRAVKKFLELNNQSQSETVEEQLDEGNFVPPKTYTECLRLVNKYTYDMISMQDASERDKAGINTLIRYLHSPRFVQMINTYQDEKNRELFLAEFIRSCFDKPDITTEELNLYINLCSDFCLSASIQAQIELLNTRLNNITEDEDAKISMSLAETISVKTKEYNDCLARQQRLIQSLNGSRAERLKKRQDASSNLLSLVEYVKSEKNRRRMIKVGDIKKKLVSDKVQDLLSMESIIIDVFGALPEY